MLCGEGVGVGGVEASLCPPRPARETTPRTQNHCTVSSSSGSRPPFLILHIPRDSHIVGAQEMSDDV